MNLLRFSLVFSIAFLVVGLTLQQNDNSTITPAPMEKENATTLQMFTTTETQTAAPTNLTTATSTPTTASTTTTTTTTTTSSSTKDLCSDFCDGKGNCTLVEGKPKCNCTVPYLGDRCEYKECDSKSSDQCKNGAKCRVSTVNSEMSCECLSGYQGALCEKTSCIDYCHNGATCDFDQNTNRPKCQCQERFYGTRCEFDRCSGETNKCGENCFIKYDSATQQCECMCNEKCDVTFCSYRGTCFFDTKLKCKCNVGYSGPTCVIDECRGYCFNGGECARNGTAISCNCPKGNYGRRCEITAENRDDKDKSKSLGTVAYMFGFVIIVCLAALTYFTWRRGGFTVIRQKIDNVLFNMSYDRAPQSTQSNIPYLRTTAKAEENDIFS